MSAATRRHRLSLPAGEAYRSDPFDRLMAGLEKWDRKCRASHEAFMAETQALQDALDTAISATKLEKTK